jgi:hypothetical protein
MKRFDEKNRGKDRVVDRDSPAGTRSGPRARAAMDRKFGAARATPRDFNRADPYQRAERPPRSDPARDTPFGDRLRAPARDGTIALDPDVARVFRDSEAVNEALRMVIRLARLAGGSPRSPARSFDRPRTGATAGARSGPPSGARPRPSSDRFARDERPRRGSAPPIRREPKFGDSE